MLCVADPCHLAAHPGWPLRNLLLWASVTLRCTTLQVTPSSPHPNPNPLVSVPAEFAESSRASPPHRALENELARPADTSRTNLADALGLLSSWRLSNPRSRRVASLFRCGRRRQLGWSLVGKVFSTCRLVQLSSFSSSTPLGLGILFPSIHHHPPRADPHTCVRRWCACASGRGS